MKVTVKEIEIPDEDIQKSMELIVKKHINEIANSYVADAHVKEQIKKHWLSAVEEEVKRALSDFAPLKEKIQAELERKIKSRLTALMKEG